MKITSVKAILLSYAIPKERQHRNDYGQVVKHDNVVVKVETDAGITGIGAAHGGPEAIKAVVEHELQPALIGEDPTQVERLWEKMYSGSRLQPTLERGYSHPSARGRSGERLCAIAGVDIALWDIFGKAQNLPIYRLLGAARSDIRAYASGGWAPGEQAAEEMAGYAAKGFTAVKMRAEGRDGFSVRKSLARVAAARRGIGPDVELMVDAHGSLDVATSIRLARGMEEHGVAWFEEPVSPDNHAGLAEVRRATSVPMATGERESTRFAFLSLLEKRAVDVIQPDVAIAGGFTEVRRIAALASAYGVRMAPHVWSAGVLFAASIHVVMSTPSSFIFEVSQASNPMIYEMFEEPFDIRGGRVHAPAKPGLGFTLRGDIERRFPFVPGPGYVY
ncbi:MAG: mandelate racemase/muconate lactonizing enzyme family protein [Burkholderiales bacterium]|nr:mandelate racemase/muconate lactonizing enzyme family protein [Burkholderiales bacterium]